MSVDRERLAAERDFLLARAREANLCTFSDKERWTGMSSNALVEVAFGGINGQLPYDGSDLAACYRTIQRLPKHLLSARVIEQLRAGEKAVRPDCLAWAREATSWDEYMLTAAQGDA